MEQTALANRRIGIDARYLSHGLIGGVHTYVRNLVGALCRLAGAQQWVLYADAKAPFELADLPPSASVRTLPWRNGASSVVNDFRLGALMRRDGVAVAHTPANYGFTPGGLPLVVTLHDAINLLPLREILQDDSKRPRHLLVMAYLHLMTIAAMRQRPFVITVSHYSRREILRHTPLPPDRVHVVHSAHEHDFRPLDPGSLRATRERLRLRPRVLVADAIKNPYCTLRAYRALPEPVREETSLVFFSRRPPAREVVEADARGECRLILRPARDELVALYNLADFFVFPSWYEGFGLPALEAMACGTPVIASSRGSLPEIVGEGGIIVDAEDHHAIAGVVQTAFAQDGSRARLREAALRRGADFSWEQTARQTLAVYDEAFGRGARDGSAAYRTTTAVTKTS
jgi:glycosyltransferase involved in cell wall biosynthesis